MVDETNKRHELIRDVVSKTVDETLQKMGLNPDEIYEAQKDFMYLREQRRLHEKISMRVRFVIVGFLVTGALALLVLGVKSVFGLK
jgi:hypothetical protein|tara:strand:- start:140 stop:397 length:258 start_codon:yes stop_codon:yes gene_type:complete